MATYFCEDLDAPLATGQDYPGKRFDASSGPESAANQFRSQFNIPVSHRVRVTLDGPNYIFFFTVEPGAPVMTVAPKPVLPAVGA